MRTASLDAVSGSRGAATSRGRGGARRGAVCPVRTGSGGRCGARARARQGAYLAPSPTVRAAGEELAVAAAPRGRLTRHGHRTTFVPTREAPHVTIRRRSEEVGDDSAPPARAHPRPSRGLLGTNLQPRGEIMRKKLILSATLAVLLAVASVSACVPYRRQRRQRQHTQPEPHGDDGPAGRPRPRQERTQPWGPVRVLRRHHRRRDRDRRRRLRHRPARPQGRDRGDGEVRDATVRRHAVAAGRPDHRPGSNHLHATPRPSHRSPWRSPAGQGGSAAPTARCSCTEESETVARLTVKLDL